MATKSAPTYANNFVGMFQENYVCHLIYENSKLFQDIVIFLIWTGTLIELNKFITKINHVHLSIKFDFCYSSNDVNFLDTTVKRSFTGKL